MSQDLFDDRSKPPTAREQAFDALFRANHPGLCRFVARIVDSRAVAEEIVQEVFLYIWERHERIDESTPPRAYLYRAARNAALNRLRRQRMEASWADKAAAEAMGSFEPADPVEQDELVRIIDDAINQLPERCRLIYTMSRQENLTYAEIAAALGLSVRTVDTQMTRAFRMLRERILPFLSGAALMLLGTSAGPGPIH